MKDIKLIEVNGKEVDSNDKIFPILAKSDMSNWLFFYEKKKYNDAELLYTTLSKVSKTFGIKVSKPEWIEIPDNSPLKDWTDLVDNYFGEGKNKNNFVIFLLGKNYYLYKYLKQHCLYKNNYVSQVVKYHIGFQLIKI